MKNPVFAIGLPLVAVAAFLAGTGYGRLRAPGPAAPPAAKKVAYACPMHPAVKADHAGKAPCCGMDFEPVVDSSGSAEKSGSPSPQAVDPVRRQVIGVAVAPVEKAAGARALRLFGRVVPDESRVYRLNAGIEGFIKNVSPATTGSQVRRSQLLATFAAPNGQGVFQTYILNVDAQERYRKAAAEGSPEGQSTPAANANVQQREDQMHNMGISSEQMAEMAKSRQIPAELKILSPVDGFVLARNVSPGLKFDRGAEWYRIADLSRVWIVADVFENEARALRPGVKARVTVAGDGTTLEARVAEVLPQFDPATRTLKIRLEADNPGAALRPDMFVDVVISVPYAPAIAVPLEAVVDSGLRQAVFVEKSEGVFEPREVKTGWRYGDRVEIVEGLASGERIVVAGTFFLDSESRMRPAAAASAAAGTSLASAAVGGEKRP